ncbi:uncharacterized protein LOC110838760 [Zootermopsis nevadensis]|nr:uncharacterized protein LOC110838760 [Zootermopsis nevadensis]
MKSLMSAGKFWMVFADPEQPLSKAIDPIIKRSYKKFGIFVDYDCPQGKEYLLESSAQRSLNDSFFWLIWSKTKYTSDIKTLNLNFDTEMTWVYPETDLSHFTLYDLYKINYSLPINGTLAGYWSPERGLNLILTQSKYERRHDMRGTVFTAGIVVNNIPTDNIKEEIVKPENRIKDTMATYNYRVFQLLEQSYNFSVIIKHTSLYGYVVENGKLEGLTLMLKNREVDFSITPSFMNKHHYECMDYMNARTWKYRSLALFRHPPVTRAYGAELLTPFEMNVWISCAGMWLVVILTIRFVSWVETSMFDFVATSHEEETVRSWSDSLMIIIGAISEQGTTMDSKWISWRTALLAACIMSMMVNTSYSASLVSSLLSTPMKTIRTTRDLIESSLQFAAEDISYNVELFALNPDPLVHELYEKKMAPPNRPYYKREVGLDKMRKDYFAFHTEPLNVYPMIRDTYTEKEKCDLTEVEILHPEYCFMAIPWASPYKEAITIAMRKIIQGGIVNYQDQLWQTPKPPCMVKEEFVSVDIVKISPAFLIIGAGIVLAIILLIGEIIIKKENLMKASQDLLLAKGERLQPGIQATIKHRRRTTNKPWIN